MIRSLLVWLALTLTIVVLQAIGAPLFGVTPPPLPPGSAGAGAPGVMFACAVVSNGLIAAVLLMTARRAPRRGAPVVAGLFAGAFGLGHLAGMIDGYVFGVLTGAATLRILGMMALVSLGAALVAARLTSGPPRGTPAEASWWPAPHRLALVSALYLAAYLIAGTLVYPFIESFYRRAPLPSMAVIVALQLLVRGPLFGMILAWLVGSTAGSRMSRAWLAGLAMSILGGIAPLVLTNPYFPDAVRWAHLVETSTSNLAFGVLAGLILTRPIRTRAAALAPSPLSSNGA